MTIHATVNGYKFTFDGNRSVRLDKRATGELLGRAKTEDNAYLERFGALAYELKHEIQRLKSQQFEIERKVLEQERGSIVEDPNLKRIFRKHENDETKKP